MSMIGGQVDRLRTAAQTYRRLGNHTAEGMFLEAADTICELQAENAKLRELVADTYQAFQRVIPDGHRLDLEQRMRELGVEVDG